MFPVFSFGFQSFSCSFCFMRWFIDFYQSHASSCWCYAYVCVYSIYALTTPIWSYMRIYLFVPLVVYWSSRCLVTKLLHLFVWVTALLFNCMYDCCLSIHFFCITDSSLTPLFFDWLVYLFISFFPSFDESWVACASTNKIRTYTTYTYNIQLTVNLSQKMTRVFDLQVNWSGVAIVPGSSAAKCSKATSRAAGVLRSHGRCGVLRRRPWPDRDSVQRPHKETCGEAAWMNGFLSIGIEWYRILGSKHLELCFNSVLVVAHHLRGTIHDILWLLADEQLKSSEGFFDAVQVAVFTRKVRTGNILGTLVGLTSAK